MRNGNGDRVFVFNKTRDAFIATEAAVANTYIRRLVGLLGKSRRWLRPGNGLLIKPSRGVHTIGMLFPLDLVYLNENNEVVYVEEYVQPFSIAKVCLRANSVLELPPHTIFRTGTRVGDHIVISQL